jgi:hypothetical protein
MKYILSVFVILMAAMALTSAADYSRIPLLKWAGPPGSHPETYEDWISQHPYMPFSWFQDRFVPGDGRQGNVVIICQQSIAAALTSALDQLSNNLQYEGYTVYSFQMTGGTPESLRAFLQNQYNTNNIEGALLVGNLPVAWFEIANDFNTYGYADFPIDLYYMDLDGTWLDTMTTGNGKYDGHTGEINPEIFIGRLTPTGIGTDTVTLKNYFRKNNAYRYDTLALQHQAMVFCDDDWIPWAPEWAANVSLLYPDTMDYWNAETTRAAIYRTKLDTPMAWVALFAHSSPALHQFTYNSGGSYDYYYSNEYASQNPPVNFYNHFACSFSRYTTSGYGGGQSIFNQSYGLGEVGSTKTGSMLEFYYFYEPLSQQKTLGEAFKDWFTYITSNGVTFDELCWHYGMTLLSDPFLKPTGHNYAVTERRRQAAVNNPLVVRGNPSGNSVVIEMNVSIRSPVNLVAYNNLGQSVKTLYSGISTTGNRIIQWDFKDDAGRPLPNGAYLIKADCGGEMYTVKVVKI